MTGWQIFFIVLKNSSEKISCGVLHCDWREHNFISGMLRKVRRNGEVRKFVD